MTHFKKFFQKSFAQSQLEKHSNLKRSSLRVLGALAATFGFQESQAQSFDPPVDQPFGLPQNLNWPIISSADLDNDGDLDIIIASQDYYNSNYDYTEIHYFENIGSPESPLFAEADTVLIPEITQNFGSYHYITGAELTDLDGDGDFDLVVSEYGYTYDPYGNYDYHKMYFLENTGTPNEPIFAGPIEQPFNLPDPGYFVFTQFVDIDNDGDLDLFSQQFPSDIPSYGIRFNENIGSATSPNFGATAINPFGIQSLQYSAIPKLGDLDMDGDYDVLFIGDDGEFNFLENIGNVESPMFDQALVNPFGLDTIAEPFVFQHLLDIDSDGDLDMLVASPYGYYYTNNPIQFYNNSQITGLSEISEIDVKVFPNPSTDYLEVLNSSEIKFNQLRLIDISGKLVYNKSINSNTTSVDLSNFNSGSYILLLTNEDVVFRETIIKN